MSLQLQRRVENKVSLTLSSSSLHIKHNTEGKKVNIMLRLRAKDPLIIKTEKMNRTHKKLKEIHRALSIVNECRGFKKEKRGEGLRGKGFEKKESMRFRENYCKQDSRLSR